MKVILSTLLVLCSLSVFAQKQVTALPEGFLGTFYRDNPIWIRLQYPATVTKASAILFKGKGLAPSAYQPVVIDSSATGLTLHWPTAKNLEDVAYLQIKLNNYVSIAATLNVGYQSNASAIRRDTLKLGGIASAPILQLSVQSGISGNAVTTTKYYPVSGVTRNYTLPLHNLASKKITGYFIRSDNNQVDPLWYPAYLNDNQAILRGPPLETATGTVVVTIYTQ